MSQICSILGVTILSVNQCPHLPSHTFIERFEVGRYEPPPFIWTHRGLIDGILMSNELRDVISNIRISNYGNNVSDHLPVELTLRASVSVFEPQKHKSKPLINWGKLSQNDLELFEQKLTQGLNAIIIPSHGVFHGSYVCLNDSHKLLIKNYYDNIITAIINAESVLPKTNPSIHRSFWIEELSESKRVSLECTNFWKDSGKPLSGPIFQCKKNCQNR